MTGFVTVRAYGGLSARMGPGEARVPLAPDMRVSDVAKAVGIDPEETGFVFIDDHEARWTDPAPDGAVVGFMAYVAGG